MKYVVVFKSLHLKMRCITGRSTKSGERHCRGYAHIHKIDIYITIST